MKFGKYLASRQLELPEYAGHFIDYKALKKLIKQLSCQNEPSSSSAKLQEYKAQFFFRVERELEKVNSFYLEKQSNLAATLDLLVMKKAELLEKKDNMDSNTLFEGSGIRSSISYLNLYQNFKKLHQDLIRLQHFIELNETGFSKVVKKWDKRSKSHTRELFISSAVSVQPVFHKNEINELSDLVTQCLFDLQSLVDGDFTSLSSASNISNKPDFESNTTGNGTTNNNINNNINLSSTSGSSSNTIPLLSSRRSSFKEFTRHQSIIKVTDGEIDGLYASFVNVATMEEDRDSKLLVQWVERVKESSKTASNSSITGSGASTIRYKFSNIFLLAITNLKISDSFLATFLKLIDYNIDFEFNSDDLDNKKNIIHECCSILPASKHENNHHTVINNGVKIVSSNDSIKHSRTFIVKYIMDNVSSDLRSKLLTSKASNGRTCLHYAAQYNRLDLLDIVLPYFPKQHIDDLDNDSMSALLLAIKHTNYDVITKLVEAGSNCFPTNDDNKPQYLPVNYACKFGNYQILEYILSNNPPNRLLINQQDVEGLFPLHTVARSGHFSLIKLLIEYGADVNQIDGLNHWPPIFYCASEGHVKTTQELVKFGAKLDIVDQDGYNVLYYCFVEGHILVLNELLSYYDDILGKDTTKVTIENFSKLANVPTLNTQGKIKGKPAITNEEKKNFTEFNSKKTDPVNRSTKNSSYSNVTIFDEEMDSEDSDKPHIDTIPDLQLPPPILPLRRYGHNFLEQKVLIELIFPSNDQFIKLFNSLADLKPGRLTLSSNISDIVPRNIQLPISQENKNDSNCIFQTEAESLHEFRIDFEIFPKFGTRIIAKTTALSFSEVDTTSPEMACIQLPLFDLRLRNIGEIKFNYQIIFPFAGTLLETSKFDTYWKSSTSFVKNRNTIKLNAGGSLSPNNFLSSNINNTIGSSNKTSINSGNPSAIKNGNDASPSLINGENITNENTSIVTATSLSGEYLRLKVCLLNDGTPVICPFWSIAVTDNIDLYLPNLSQKQLTSITDDLFDYCKILHDLALMTPADLPLIKKLLKIMYIPLDKILEVLNFEINLNLEIVFPSQHEFEILPIIASAESKLNIFIDRTLNCVFNHIRAQKAKGKSGGRSIVFLSSNSLICKILNWKQPNFPVLLIMNGIKYNSSKKRFDSRTTNGLILEEIDVEGGNSRTSNKLEAKDQEKTIRSIKEAVNFSINNNLIGIVISVHVLNLVPKLIPLIRSRGLVLVASSDVHDDPDIQDGDLLGKELDAYTKTEINGLRFDDVLKFKEDVSM